MILALLPLNTAGVLHHLIFCCASGASKCLYPKITVQCENICAKFSSYDLELGSSAKYLDHGLSTDHRTQRIVRTAFLGKRYDLEFRSRAEYSTHGLTQHHCTRHILCTAISDSWLCQQKPANVWTSNCGHARYLRPMVSSDETTIVHSVACVLLSRIFVVQAQASKCFALDPRSLAISSTDGLERRPCAQRRTCGILLFFAALAEASKGFDLVSTYGLKRRPLYTARVLHSRLFAALA